MIDPDGDEHQNQIGYDEVEEPAQLVYDHGSDDHDFEQFRVTVTFDERGSDGTELTMEMRFPTAAELDEAVEFGADEGAKQTLGRLSQFLTDGDVRRAE